MSVGYNAILSQEAKVILKDAGLTQYKVYFVPGCRVFQRSTAYQSKMSFSICLSH